MELWMWVLLAMAAGFIAGGVYRIVQVRLGPPKHCPVYLNGSLCIPGEDYTRPTRSTIVFNYALRGRGANPDWVCLLNYPWKSYAFYAADNIEPHTPLIVTQNGKPLLQEPDDAEQRLPTTKDVPLD